MDTLQEELAPVTLLGVVEGEMLTYVEANGSTAVRRLIRELPWSSPAVMMAVGALIRAGLVRAIRHDLEILIEPLRDEGRQVRTAEAWEDAGT